MAGVGVGGGDVLVESYFGGARAQGGGVVTDGGATVNAGESGGGSG